MTRFVLAGVIVLSPVCGDSQGEEEGEPSAEVTQGSPPRPNGDRKVDDRSSVLPSYMSPGGSTAEGVPQGASDMERFLTEVHYQDFEHGARHVRSPVHGDARAYLNDVLVESLESEREVTTPGAAIVLELREPGTPKGWLVMRKQTRSSQSNSWLYYEAYVLGEDESFMVGAQGLGARQCASCHADGQDFLLGAY